jgi:hypothetical protein
LAATAAATAAAADLGSNSSSSSSGPWQQQQRWHLSPQRLCDVLAVMEAGWHGYGNSQASLFANGSTGSADVGLVPF